MIVTPTPEAVQRAAEGLRAGELVGMPTETVYGLAGDALNISAVNAIFAAKGRPADHPLIVHLPDAQLLPEWAARIPREALALAKAFWPGPLTLILAREDGVPDAVTGGQDTVGLRVPAHPVALALLQAFGGGLAAPSANRFGRISPTTAEHVDQELGDAVAWILDGGACTVGIESTILDLSRDQAVILRPGAIGAAQIAHVIGRMPMVRVQQGSDGAVADCPRVSGSLAAHYAPRTPLRLIPAPRLLQHISDQLGLGHKVAVLSCTVQPVQHPGVCWRFSEMDPDRYAHDLYANLRALDLFGADVMLVENIPNGDAWRAIDDRLGRAAVGSGLEGTPD